MKNHANRHNKVSCEDLGRQSMKIQKASEDIIRRRNFIPSPKTSYMEENTQKTKKQMITR